MEFRASHILVKDQSTAEKLYERVKKGEKRRRSRLVWRGEDGGSF